MVTTMAIYIACILIHPKRVHELKKVSIKRGGNKKWPLIKMLHMKF